MFHRPRSWREIIVMRPLMHKRWWRDAIIDAEERRLIWWTGRGWVLTVLGRAVVRDVA